MAAAPVFSFFARSSEENGRGARYDRQDKRTKDNE